jgi:uncharacterized membrane protein YeaQ/YmgE (transglycosylase-associated protein family)
VANVNGLVWWIIVGLIAGFVTGKLMKGSGYGILMDIVLGMVGAVIGGYLMTALGIGGGGLVYSIVVAIIGACLLVWLIRLISGRKVV